MRGRRRVCVGGAGILGLTCALELLHSGVGEVLLCDPDDDRANASAVAAGLLAPLGETLFDPSAARHHSLMAEAFDLWAGFAAKTGLDLDLQGVVIPLEYAARAEALGSKLRPHPLGVLASGDGLVLNPTDSLKRLRLLFLAAGGQFVARRISPDDRDDHDVLVLAAGAQSPSLERLAPELRHLRPVKGQIAVLPHGPKDGPSLRWEGGYLAPQASGARVGATMEPGLDNTEVEPAAIARLIEAALIRKPGLDARGAWGQAGVRMQTLDDLPLVGASRTPKVFLATGARRNGWLLAPLVARMIAAYCRDEDAGKWAKVLNPARFD